MKKCFHIFNGQNVCNNLTNVGQNLATPVKGTLMFHNTCLFSTITEVGTAIGMSFHYNNNLLYNSITIGWIPVKDKIDLYIVIDVEGNVDYKYVKSVDVDKTIDYTLSINENGFVVAKIDDLTAISEFKIPAELTDIENPHVAYPTRKWSKLIFPRINEPHKSIKPIKITVESYDSA